MSSEFKQAWKVLLAATLGVSMATTAIPFYSIGVFITPLEAAKDWSRTDISLAISIFGFILPLSLLSVGYLTDRFGLRLVAASGHLMLGLVFMALSFTGDNVWIFWFLYAAAAGVAVGASPITFTRALIGHFDRHRGIAIGICMSGAGLGAAVAPPVLGSVIEVYGWAAGYRLLGTVALVLAPLVFLWLKEKPETAVSNVQSTAGTKTLQGVNQPPVFLLILICLAFFAIAVSVNGYIVHLVPLMIDSGLQASRAASIAGLVGVAVILGRLIVGWLLDKVAVGMLGMAVFLLAAIGVLILDMYGGRAAPVTAIFIGLTIGAEVDIVAYLVSRLFRPADYARYFSRVYSAFMLGSGLSPLLAGRIVDHYGSYAPFLHMSMLILVLVSIAFLWLHLAWLSSAQTTRPKPGK